MIILSRLTLKVNKTDVNKIRDLTRYTQVITIEFARLIQGVSIILAKLKEDYYAVWNLLSLQGAEPVAAG